MTFHIVEFAFMHYRFWPIESVVRLGTDSWPIKFSPPLSTNFLLGDVTLTDPPASCMT